MGFSKKPVVLAVLSVLTALQTSRVVAQMQSSDRALGDIQVISTTPLPGLGSSLAETPSAVQLKNSKTIETSNAVGVGDFLNESMVGVHVNDVQGNPFQPDVNYRGYTASPLLGTPQGLSVYLDGVRMNQPFGDVVSWDLLPKTAISTLTLMPGSNPLFGLNTLGGAISIQTKDGRSHPGSSVQSYVGSYQRRSLEVEHGGSNERGYDWYLSGNLFKENGWREDSPSDVRQFFSKLGYQNGATRLKLSIGHFDNKLTGNGLQEFRLLKQNNASIYTKPDTTNNVSNFLNLGVVHTLSEHTSFSGNVYYRTIKTSTLNGDLNEDSLGKGLVYGDGETQDNTPFPKAACINATQDQDEQCTGLLNRTSSKQSNRGFSGQFTHITALGNNSNSLVVGAGYDANRTHFLQGTQYGYLLSDRSVNGIDAFDTENQVDLSSRSSTKSVYGMNTYSVGQRLHLNLAGRWNQTRVNNTDALIPAGEPGTLTGDHSFHRFNPSVGLSYLPSSDLNTYASYSESNRAPTSIELGCADPLNPCKLPNSLAGDPPLKQVVAKTMELGIRAKASSQVNVSASVFRTDNHDDILFLASPLIPSLGYFLNVSKTRRQGVELAGDYKGRNHALTASLTLLEATYESEESFSARANSTADATGQIPVKKGDRIPLIPNKIFKLNGQYDLSQSWVVKAGMQAVSGVFARGNENNQHAASGGDYLGSGKTSGYAVFNVGSRYQLSKQTEVFAHINNLFDRRYVTASQLAPTGIGLTGAYASPADTSTYSSFNAPGAPRIAWAGVKFRF